MLVLIKILFVVVAIAMAGSLAYVVFLLYASFGFITATVLACIAVGAATSILYFIHYLKRAYI